MFFFRFESHLLILFLILLKPFFILPAAFFQTLVAPLPSFFAIFFALPRAPLIMAIPFLPFFLKSFFSFPTPFLKAEKTSEKMHRFNGEGKKTADLFPLSLS